MNREIEERIAALAARKHGVLARRQLLDAGLTSAAIQHRLRSRWLHPVHAGVYLLGPLVSPWAREMAAVVAGGPEAVASHFSAVSLWALRAAGASQDASHFRDGSSIRGSDDPVDITVTGANRGRRPRIRVHRVQRLDADERTVCHGIPVTTPARTLIDVATTVGTRELEGFIARAEREGLIERGALMSLLDRHAGRPGTRAVRDLLQMGAGPALTRSEAEMRFLRLVREAGLPEPETNVAFGPYEIDFLWRSARIAVEVDGYRYHASRPRFEGDRRRDVWLVGVGITVVRLSWDQIVRQPLSTAVQLGQALARSVPDGLTDIPPARGRAVAGRRTT